MRGYLLHLVFHNRNVVAKYIHLTTQSSQTLGYISSYYILKNSCSDFTSLYNVTFETYFVNMLKVYYRFVNANQFVVGLMRVTLLQQICCKSSCLTMYTQNAAHLLQGYLLHLVFHIKNVATLNTLLGLITQSSESLGYIFSFYIYKFMY